VSAVDEHSSVGQLNHSGHSSPGWPPSAMEIRSAVSLRTDRFALTRCSVLRSIRSRRCTRIKGDSRVVTLRGKVPVGSGWEFNACHGSPIHGSLRAHAGPVASIRSFAPPAPTGCIGIAWTARPRANLRLAGRTRFARSPTITFARIASVNDASCDCSSDSAPPASSPLARDTPTGCTCEFRRSPSRVSLSRRRWQGV
jgi:hypothetical protein